MRKNARTTNADESRAKIKLLVSTAGASLGTLLKALEKEGNALSAEDFEKVFAFLNHTLKTIEAQARKDRIAISASQFDFDAALPPAAAPNASEPETPAPPTAAPPAVSTAAQAPTPTPTQPAGWRKPTGRVSKNSPNAEMAGKAVHTHVETPLITPAERLVPKEGDNKSLAGTLLDKADGIVLMD